MNPSGPCLGTRVGAGYTWLDYKTVAKRRTAFASGLVSLEEKLGLKGWRLGIYAQNRAEWVIADLAAQSLNVPSVALYDTLGVETVEFVLGHAEIPVLVTTVDKVSGVLEMSNKVPVKVIITMDSLEGKEGKVLRVWAKEKGVDLFEFGEMEVLGKKVVVRKPGKEDVASVCYTSGTFLLFECNRD